jgi:hypothetical protein
LGFVLHVRLELKLAINRYGSFRGKDFRVGRVQQHGSHFPLLGFVRLDQPLLDFDFLPQRRVLTLERSLGAQVDRAGERAETEAQQVRGDGDDDLAHARQDNQWPGRLQRASGATTRYWKSKSN